jgi:hypothetical protein
LAGIVKKIKKATRDKIVHSAFELGHSILTALEEQIVEVPEEKNDGKPPE